MTAQLEASAKRGSHRAFIAILSIALIAVLCALLWSMGIFAKKVRVALVTSGDGPYWDVVIAGAKQAAKEQNVDLTIVRPKSDTAVQSQAIVDVTAAKYDGVAISPINPRAEAALLGGVAANSTLVTFDSDSPISRRLCFVGTDNYAAGRMSGAYARQLLPSGGEVIVCIGQPEKENALHRRQGVIDELLSRSNEPLRPNDPLDQPAKGDQYSVVATIIDNSDAAATTELATQAIKAHPNVKCIIGLLGYQAPAILKALEQAGAAAQQVHVIGFDTDERTLKGIESGQVFATIMQDQYGCGYQAVRILADELHGNRGGLPMFQTFPLACQAVTKNNLASVRAQIAAGGPVNSGEFASAPGSSDGSAQPTAADAAPATAPSH